MSIFNESNNISNIFEEEDIESSPHPFQNLEDFSFLNFLVINITQKREK